jgi:hypothetical protein
MINFVEKRNRQPVESVEIALINSTVAEETTGMIDCRDGIRASKMSTPIYFC